MPSFLSLPSSLHMQVFKEGRGVGGRRRGGAWQSDLFKPLSHAGGEEGGRVDGGKGLDMVVRSGNLQ